MPVKGEKFKPILALLMTLGFFGLIGALVFIEIPPGNRDIINIVIGGLIASVLDIVKSYFQKQGV